METTTDTRIKLPPPNYKVEQINNGGKRHYEVTPDKGDKIKLPGVTGTLSVIAKPALIPWANNQGLSSLCASLIAMANGSGNSTIKADAAFIAEAIKKAKKNKKTLVASLAAALTGRFSWSKKAYKINPILLAGMIEAAINAPDAVKDEAADLGSLAHEYFDLYCQGKAPPMELVFPPIRPSVERFHKWIGSSGLVIAAGETFVASLRHGFGGELDALFMVEDPSKTPPELDLQEGDYVTGDYKTSNGIYDEMAFQVSAYREGLLETYGIDSKAGVIVRFGKDQPEDEKGNKLPLEFEAKWLANPHNSFMAFLAAKDLQKRSRDNHFIDEEDR